MAFTISVIVISAFLSGAAVGIFAIVVAAIHRDDRAKNLTSAPRSRTEAATRHLLGVGVRTPATTRSPDQPCPLPLPPESDQP